MRLKEMELRDLSQVMRLENDLFSSPWHYEDYVYELLFNPFAHYYVLLDKDMIGYIGIWISYGKLEITTIGVNKNYQGQGYSKILMDKALTLGQENDCEEYSLEVRVSNDKAIALYEKYGFKNVAVRKNYYKDNGEDAYLMVKEVK